MAQVYAAEAASSGWVRFWNAGTWWKALLLVVAYWIVFQLISLLIVTVFGGVLADDPLSEPLTVLLSLAAPILLAGLLLLVFVRSVGWVGAVFGPQPVRGRAWMWVAVVLIVVPILMRLMATDWSAYSLALVAAVLVFGLCVGFTEELATRGIVVTMLRSGGHGEKLVFCLSSLYFALLHSGNILAGQAPVFVALTVVYTFGFGAMMYLSMRVTGRIMWAMLLHGATDPTTSLAVGGVDIHSGTGGDAGLIAYAGMFNLVYIAVALLAVFYVKGRADQAAPLSITGTRRREVSP